MGETVRKRPVLSCAVLFAVCCLVRLIEYFVIRTDETVIAENFIHKVFGIILLALVLHSLRTGWQGIGFTRSGAASGLVKGLLLGSCCFAAAYSIECLTLYLINRDVSLAFYISGFSLSGEAVRRTGILFLVLCLVCNVINVWMEEGLFRGLFMRLLAPPFVRAVLLTAALFGIWHWVMPLRDYLEGRTSFAALLIMGIGYLLLAGMMSIKWSLLCKMTGSLWMGLGDHLFNNVVVTNLLHVVSDGEADQLQLIRILIGQALSFFLVLLACRKTARAVR